MDMVPLVTDENFYGPILRALVQQESSLDVVRVQDVGLMGKSDQRILEWAAERQRVLLTHDRETIPEFAYNRIRNEKDMTGVVVVDDELVPGRLAFRILSLVVSNDPAHFRNRVFFLSE